MDKLKKACETKKRTLESVIAEADGELGKQEPSLEMLMSLRPKLLRCKDRFLIASDCLIEQLIKADREDEEIEDVDIVQANLFGRSEGVLQKMEQLLAKPTVDRESIVSGGNEGKSNLHRLPKLELPKFGGEAREWLQFWSAFQSVHDDDSISACVKFQYLQNCMIKGSVSEEIVSSFPNSAANYPLAISTLKERFGREDMLVEVYVRDLIAITLENAHGRNTTPFSTVYVRLSSQLRALGSLGVTTDKCAAILYPMVESALPEDIFVARACLSLTAWRIRLLLVVVQSPCSTYRHPSQFPLIEVPSSIRVWRALPGFKMDKLKKACETKKRTLESVIAEADGELGKQEPSLEMLMSLRPKLLRCKDRFLIASDCLIEQLIKADREDEEIEDVDIVQANLFGRSEGVLQKMEQLLAKPTVDRESIVSGGNEGKSNLHRLPKLELPKFGGEAREWLQFWSAFQSVHDDDSISACVKFQYLQNCMIKGSVSEEIVSSFPNSAANYPLAISTLKERFGREDMLVEVYVRDLIAITLENAHGRNTTPFSTVYVRLSSQLRALGSLGVTTDKCAAILFSMVESALPEDLFVARACLSLTEPDMEDKSSREIWSDKNDEAFGIIITTLTKEQAGMFIGETNAKK
ncbi:hypothetical protein LAZ67_X002732, partial [Cordylochernes scorpioides]